MRNIFAVYLIAYTSSALAAPVPSHVAPVPTPSGRAENEAPISVLPQFEWLAKLLPENIDDNDPLKKAADYRLQLRDERDKQASIPTPAAVQLRKALQYAADYLRLTEEACLSQHPISETYRSTERFLAGMKASLGTAIKNSALVSGNLRFDVDQDALVAGLEQATAYLAKKKERYRGKEGIFEGDDSRFVKALEVIKRNLGAYVPPPKGLIVPPPGRDEIFEATALLTDSKSPQSLCHLKLNADTTAPRVDVSTLRFYVVRDGKQIKIDEKTPLNAGETLHATYKISDDKSGVSDPGMLIGSRPDDQFLAMSKDSYDPETHTARASLKFPTDAVPGTYKITQLYSLSDRAGNSANLPLPKPLSFEVKGKGPPAKPEVDFKGATFFTRDKDGKETPLPMEDGLPTVQDGQEFHVRIKMKSGSPIERTGDFTGQTGDGRFYMATAGQHDQVSGTTTYALSTAKHQPGGTYSLTKLDGVRDAAGQQLSLTLPQPLKFKVVTKDPDSAAPEVDQTSFQWNIVEGEKEFPAKIVDGAVQVRAGQKLKLSFKMKDDKSGVASPGNATGSDAQGNFVMFHDARYDEKTGIASNALEFSPYAVSGVYELTQLYNASDRARNGVDIKLATPLRIQVTGTEAKALVSSAKPAPVPPAAPGAPSSREKMVTEAIGNLGHRDFRTREKATNALVSLATGAESALRTALTSPDPEVARRAKDALDRIAAAKFE